MGRVLVERLNKQVLYVNATSLTREGAVTMGNGRTTLTEVIRDDVPLDDALTRLGPGGLHAVRLASHEVCGNGSLVSKTQYAALLTALSNRFSMILVDVAPPAEHPESLTLLDMLDGVVLVVESEATRVRAAQALRRNVESHGGRVLGAILNKRRHRIPDFLYRRL
jgi:MinD-like ATPase involved in chromosome partitioning or flagellar assembly